MSHETHADNQALVQEVNRLREYVEQQDKTIEHLEEQLTTIETTQDAIRDRVDGQQETINRLEDEHRTVDSKVTAAINKASTNQNRLVELQGRELEKGAHLLNEHIDEANIDVPGDRLEKITKDDGDTYTCLPEATDPLDRERSVSLSHGDLLPIQQLARMDDDMLQSATTTFPDELAAKLWKARTDPEVGDNPWQTGCKDVREYVKASDLKHWIRRQRAGISDEYAKKLVSRTISSLLELSKHRLGVRKQRERKNGLKYTERRIVLKTDTPVPGETGESSDQPETNGVHG